MLKYAVLISGGVLVATLVSAQTNCGPGLDPCPLSAPCCSEYGFCGIGAFCLGGCNPFWSNTVESCRAMPICENAEYTFEDLSTLVKHADFDGNSTAFAWTIDEGEPLTADGNNIALVLTEDNKGTKISSTKYVHYGTITARMRTGKWAGVVTAFITMSNVKDEIDLEWPGANVNEVQSNFFFQGNVDYVSGSNGGYHRDLSDTHLNYHDYTIDWQPETLRFLIDGQEVRSVSKESTLKDGKYEYPTTPARIQFSIWPAGIPDMPQGTVEWAGGMINWDDPDYVAWDNKFVALVEKVTVQCDDALPIGPKTVSYQYGANDTQGIPSVFATNETTLLNGASRFVAGLTGVNPYAFFSVAVGTVLGLMTL